MQPRPSLHLSAFRNGRPTAAATAETREAPSAAAFTRPPRSWLRLRGISRNNIHDLDVDFPLGVFTTVTGVSGSGKSSLVSQVLVELIAKELGHPGPSIDDELCARQGPLWADTVEAVESRGALKNQRNDFVTSACPKLPF